MIEDPPPPREPDDVDAGYVPPDPDATLKDSDSLVVAGSDEALAKLPKAK